MRGLFVEPAANSYLLAERDIYLENPEIKIRVRAGLGSWTGPHTCMHLPPCNLKISDAPGSSDPRFIKEKHHEAEFGTHSL